MKLLELVTGELIKVDDEDYDYLMQFEWRSKKYFGGKIYAIRYIKNPLAKRKIDEMLMHAEIFRKHNLDFNPKTTIRHRDKDGFNNQKYNLYEKCNKKHLNAPLIIGCEYGWLTIISNRLKIENKRPNHYKCKCRCGNIIYLPESAVRTGNTKSCGCYSTHVKKTLTLLPDNGGLKYQVFLQYRQKAKDRDISFCLTRQQLSDMIILPCIYCGIRDSNEKIENKGTQIERKFRYNGIDRVDSKIGYIISNCVPCCKQCNLAKMSMPRAEFIGWIKRVYEYQLKKI